MFSDYNTIKIILFDVFKVLLIIVPLLIFIAYLTYFERKVIGYIQLRRGPNVVGPFGLLQPFADGIKLLTKETIVPSKSEPTCPRKNTICPARTTWQRSLSRFCSG